MFIKRKDILLAAAVLAAALLCYVGFRLSAGADPDRAVLTITVDGEEYGTYSLAEDQQIEINGTNICEISDGEVRMVQADCPDQLCMHQKAISGSGGTIVCLPNRVVLSVASDTEPEVDSITG